MGNVGKPWGSQIVNLTEYRIYLDFENASNTEYQIYSVSKKGTNMNTA